ncbi:MAG: lamin tail domain-containing protein, partial [Anaerolineae bacterium]|nr:lamin tail domain-containing protein [Anaerolineae bacterium]
MNAHRSRIIGGLMVLILVLLGGGFGAGVIEADPGPPGGPSVQTSAPPASVLINEVMPKPEAGNYEWVELINRTYRIHLPVVLKGFTSSATLTAEHGAAPLAALSAGADLDGYQITDEDEHVYTIPSALPPVPPGALVLIYFGDGTDDYDFSDGKATLYTGSALADIFEDAGDQVSLYSGDVHNASTIVDFVAWGIEPQEDAANAAAAGLWQSYWFLTFESGLGDTWDGDVLAPNESLGR